MTSKAQERTSQPPFIPAITTVAVPLLIFGRQKKEATQNPQGTQEAPKKPKKKTGLAITKYEVAEDKIKFQDIKGLFKKRLVTVKEFPVYEVSAVESSGNWLSLAWKDQNHEFLLRKKTDSFAKLQEQLQTMLQEHQKAIERQEKAALSRTELLYALNTSLPIVDFSFNILIDLHQKRIDWSHIEDNLQALGSSFSLKAQSLTPLEVDFSRVAGAVKSQTPKETSQETFNGLKIVHDYFMELKNEDDLAEVAPYFEYIKTAVLAYYTLNDLLLARVVGEKDSSKEAAYLGELLKKLSEGTSIKLDVEQLMPMLDKHGADVAWTDIAGGVRAVFREQVKQLKAIE